MAGSMQFGVQNGTPCSKLWPRWNATKAHHKIKQINQES